MARGASRVASTRQWRARDPHGGQPGEGEQRQHGVDVGEHAEAGQDRDDHGEVDAERVEAAGQVVALREQGLEPVGVRGSLEVLDARDAGAELDELEIELVGGELAEGHAQLEAEPLPAPVSTLHPTAIQTPPSAVERLPSAMPSERRGRRPAPGRPDEREAGRRQANAARQRLARHATPTTSRQAR